MIKLSQLGKILFTKFDLNYLKEEQKNILRTLVDNNNRPINFNPYDPNIQSLIKNGILIYMANHNISLLKIYF